MIYQIIALINLYSIRILRQVVPIAIQNKRTTMFALTPLNITEKMLFYSLLDGRMYLIPSYLLCA